MRTTREVFENHLLLTLDWEIEEDVKANYSTDCTVITAKGISFGHDGIFKVLNTLNDQLPDADFLYTTRIFSGEIALLEWQAESDDRYVDDGADTLLIRGGLIVAQTIHYNIKSRMR